MRSDAQAMMWNKTFWIQDRRRSLSYIPAFKGKATAHPAAAVAAPSHCMDRPNNVSRSFFLVRKKGQFFKHISTFAFISTPGQWLTVAPTLSDILCRGNHKASSILEMQVFLASRLRGQTEQPGVKEKRSSAILSHPRLAPSFPESFNKTSLLF